MFKLKKQNLSKSHSTGTHVSKDTNVCCSHLFNSIKNELVNYAFFLFLVLLNCIITYNTGHRSRNKCKYCMLSMLNGTTGKCISRVKGTMAAQKQPHCDRKSSAHLTISCPRPHSRCSTPFRSISCIPTYHRSSSCEIHSPTGFGYKKKLIPTTSCPFPENVR